MNTSAYVDIVFYEEIVIAAQKFNLSMSGIFKDLMCIVLKEAIPGRITGKLTEYQNHVTAGWETLHYSLDSREVEIYSGSRQKLKISISKLAFIGFILFWKKLIKKYEKERGYQKTENIFSSYDKYIKKMGFLKPVFIKRLKLVKLE
ncbi:MAG: hypothetical protein JW982_01890 [Spirochaetes bacterium]|nr:hypothetical protein [Spirochaetota bacterium]